MERALLDDLHEDPPSARLVWRNVEDVAIASTEQWDGVSAATAVAWRRAALSLARKGLVDVAYQPMQGARRMAAVRLPAPIRADTDALAIAAVRGAVTNLMAFQHLPAFTHGMVFAFSRWQGHVSGRFTVTGPEPPQANMLAAATGHHRRYKNAQRLGAAARSLVRLSNWDAAGETLSLQLDWVPAFLDAAAAEDSSSALEQLEVEVANRAEAWFWGELSAVYREEQIAALPSYQTLGKRGKPPETLRNVVRAALFDGDNNDIPLGYHDARANLPSTWRPVSDTFIRQR